MFKLTEWVRARQSVPISNPPYPPTESEAHGKLYRSRKESDSFAVLYQDRMGRVWYRLGETAVNERGKAGIKYNGEWEIVGGGQTKGQDVGLRREMVFEKVREYLKELGKPASRPDVRDLIAITLIEGFGLAESSTQTAANIMFGLIENERVRDLYCVNPEERRVKRLYSFEEGRNKRFDNASLLNDLKNEIQEKNS